jgi:hypothetical protein
VIEKMYSTEQKIAFVLDKKLKKLVKAYCDKTSTTMSEYMRKLIREDLIEKELIDINEINPKEVLGKKHE